MHIAEEVPMFEIFKFLTHWYRKLSAIEPTTNYLVGVYSEKGVSDVLIGQYEHKHAVLRTLAMFFCYKIAYAPSNFSQDFVLAFSVTTHVCILKLTGYCQSQ